MTDQTTVAWFRRDLRLADNPMLAAAVEAGNVAPLFVFDEALLRGSRASRNRNWFLLGCLRDLRESLRGRGGELYVRYGDPAVEVPRFAERMRSAGRVLLTRLHALRAPPGPPRR